MNLQHLTQYVLFSIPFPGRNINVYLWTLLGLAGNVMFTSRVITQWLASERAGKIIIPVSFWWMSTLATLIMAVYAIGREDAPMVINFCAALVPYLRNLAIYYRPNRPPRNTVVIAAIAILLAVVPVFFFWDKHDRHDGWFVFGLLGSAIFTSRFFVQWVQSEGRRANHMGRAFWWISLVGGSMLLVYSIGVRDLPFIIGFVFNIVPYTRNLQLVYRQRRRARELGVPEEDAPAQPPPAAAEQADATGFALPGDAPTNAR